MRRSACSTRRGRRRSARRPSASEARTASTSTTSPRSAPATPRPTSSGSRRPMDGCAAPYDPGHRDFAVGDLDAGRARFEAEGFAPREIVDFRPARRSSVSSWRSRTDTRSRWSKGPPDADGAPPGGAIPERTVMLAVDRGEPSRAGVPRRPPALPARLARDRGRLRRGRLRRGPARGAGHGAGGRVRRARANAPVDDPRASPARLPRRRPPPRGRRGSGRRGLGLRRRGAALDAAVGPANARRSGGRQLRGGRGRGRGGRAHRDRRHLLRGGAFRGRGRPLRPARGPGAVRPRGTLTRARPPFPRRLRRPGPAP